MSAENPPAFPTPANATREWCEGHPQNGMTLRDFFAAASLMGQMADPNNMGSNQQNAAVAYSIAEAMLAEREKRMKEAK